MLFDKIWARSTDITAQKNREELRTLSQELLQCYISEGRLLENPFHSTTLRKLSLPTDTLKGIIKGQSVLVTGGLGCVGAALIEELVQLEPGIITILDRADADEGTDYAARGIRIVQVDICNEQELFKIFKETQPKYVFHVAAQRDPGYAEEHVIETIQSNVIGSYNVIQACERTDSVVQCVFSSTGKASRYFTNEIYAATKKICEYLFDTYSRLGRVKYSMTRFTHILDNSLMHQKIQARSLNGFISIHSPGKYVTAQNAGEAAGLMLNAMVYAESGRSNFLAVRHLEWPVESLEVALFYLKENAPDGFIYFAGNPAGYTEKFFRGQMDWSQPDDLNLLVNVYESRYRKYNKEGDIVMSHIMPVDSYILAEGVKKLRGIHSEQLGAKTLVSYLKQLVVSSLRWVDPIDTVNILNWGLQPEYLELEGLSVDIFEPMVSMLSDSIAHTHNMAS